MLVGCGLSYNCKVHCVGTNGTTFDIDDNGICAQTTVEASQNVDPNACGANATMSGASCRPSGDGICFNPVRLAPIVPIPDLAVPAK